MRKILITSLILISGCTYRPDPLAEKLRNEHNNIIYQARALSYEYSDLNDRRNTFLLGLSDEQLECYEQCLSASQEQNEPKTILKMRELRHLLNDEEWSKLMSLIQENDQIVQKGIDLVRRENHLKAQWQSAQRMAYINYQTSQNYIDMMQRNYNNQMMLNALYGIQTSITNLQR